jgi:hypothetical protein
MSYYQKFMTTFAVKKWVLLLTAGFFTLTSMTQGHANFSGESSTSGENTMKLLYDKQLAADYRF